MAEETILNVAIIVGLIIVGLIFYALPTLKKHAARKHGDSAKADGSTVISSELVEGNGDEEEYAVGDALGEIDPDPNKEAATKATYREPPLTVDDVRFVLEKLILLEQRIGSVFVRDVNPAALPTNADADTYANAVASAMGMSDRAFRISWEVADDKVGGYVKSTEIDSRTIPIHLDMSLALRTEARNATICHELAHVFLRRLLISLPDTHQNECLTDLTPVYLGLGPIMLNGCMSAQVSSNCAATTSQIGYLTPSQLALACDIVARMRGQCLSLCLFDKKARAAIRKSRREARELKLRYAVKPKAVIKEVESLESASGELKHCLAYAEPRFSDALRKLVSNADEISFALRRILAEASDRAGGGEPLTALQKSLDAIIFRDADEKLSGRIIAAKECMRSIGRAYHALRKLDFIGDAAGCVDFNTVHCPKCGSKLRLPTGRSGNVRCTRCSHVFASVTTVPAVFATVTSEK